MIMLDPQKWVSDKGWWRKPGKRVIEPQCWQDGRLLYLYARGGLWYLAGPYDYNGFKPMEEWG